MIPIKSPATFNTSTPTISMVGRCLSHFQPQISALAASKIKGYLLEVDIKYPTDLHNSHNDLPFMCDKMKINKVEKLVPNLKDKRIT